MARFTKQEDEKIRALALSGLGKKAIARRIGRPVASVGQRMALIGIKRNTDGAKLMRPAPCENAGQPIAVTETFAIRPYALCIPSTTALSANAVTEASSYHHVSLSWMSIQGAPA